MTRAAPLLIICGIFLSPPVWSASAMDIMAPGAHHAAQPADQYETATLSGTGSAAFGTIQEVVKQLEADPTTDWSRVNLEALRLHLRDMENITLNVEVASQDPIDSGVRLVVRPTNASAAQSLSRTLAAHGPQLLQERGWKMTTIKNQDSFRIDITTPNEDEIGQVRALGYIGMLVVGAHHSEHHWAIASGHHPHALSPSK